MYSVPPGEGDIAAAGDVGAGVDVVDTALEVQGGIGVVDVEGPGVGGGACRAENEVHPALVRVKVPALLKAVRL